MAYLVLEVAELANNQTIGVHEAKHDSGVNKYSLVICQGEKSAIVIECASRKSAHKAMAAIVNAQ